MLSTQSKQGLRTAFYALVAAFTFILLAYFLVWFPQPVVGLSFVGIEMGEWVKFLPEIRSGEIAADRNLFYLPPITLGLMIVAWTLGWPSKRWKTWAMRLIAVIIAFLAIPAFESFFEEPPKEWLFRTALIILVVVVAIVATASGDWGGKRRATVGWSLIILFGLIGAILPTWAFISILPSTRNLLARDVGIGPGVWLNIAGNVLALLVSLYLLFRRKDTLP